MRFDREPLCRISAILFSVFFNLFSILCIIMFGFEVHASWFINSSALIEQTTNMNLRDKATRFSVVEALGAVYFLLSFPFVIFAAWYTFQYWSLLQSKHLSAAEHARAETPGLQEMRSSIVNRDNRLMIWYSIGAGAIIFIFLIIHTVDANSSEMERFVQLYLDDKNTLPDNSAIRKQFVLAAMFRSSGGNFLAGFLFITLGIAVAAPLMVRRLVQSAPVALSQGDPSPWREPSYEHSTSGLGVQQDGLR